MSGQAKPLFSAHLHCVNKYDLQQRKVQVVKHDWDAAPNQHPDDIWMKEDWKNLGEVDGLLEERRQRETEPRIELFFAKVCSIVGLFLTRQRLVIYQENGNAIRNMEVSMRLLF